MFVGALVIFLASGAARYLTLDAVKQHAASLRAFTDAHYFGAIALAFAVYATAASLSLPSGTLLQVTFGLLFGRWIATALAVIAATFGATIVFLAARYLFGEAVRRRLGETGERINAEFTHDGFSWLLFMRLMPVFPYFLVNLIPALTAIRVRTYAAATLIGILPSTLIVTNLGQALGSLESTRGIFSPEALVALSLLALLALFPVLLHYLRRRA
ncbi:MAG TPA: TVP38/TMEM64 family protein [Actinomycetota bacterium]|nr:TVP38/TMEM64 family protein [Actinomycetota bacterium]